MSDEEGIFWGAGNILSCRKGVGVMWVYPFVKTVQVRILHFKVYEFYLKKGKNE